MAPDSQIQFAAILVPILGLLVASTIDSVEEDDPGWYRGFVAAFSVAAIGPIAVASSLSVLSIGISVDQVTVIVYSVVSILLSTALILGVTFYETSREMDDEDRRPYVLWLVAALLWYVGLFVLV